MVRLRDARRPREGIPLTQFSMNSRRMKVPRKLGS